MRAKKRAMVGVVLTGGCELQTPQRYGALNAYYLLAQANNIEYSEVQKIAARMGIDTAELANWGAGLLAEAQTRGMSKPTDVVLAASMAEAAQLAGRNTLTAEQINRLRSTANQFFRQTEQQARRDLVAQDVEKIKAARPVHIQNAIRATQQLAIAFEGADSVNALSNQRFDVGGQERRFDTRVLTPRQGQVLNQVLANPTSRANFASGIYGSKEVAAIAAVLKNQLVAFAVGGPPLNGRIYLVATENPKIPGNYSDYIVQTQDGSTASDGLIGEFSNKMWAGYPVIHRPDQEGLTPQQLAEEVQQSAANKLLIIAYPVTGTGASTATLQIRNGNPKSPVGFVGDLTSNMKGGGGLILKSAVSEAYNRGFPGVTFTAYDGRGMPDANAVRFPGNGEAVSPGGSLIHDGLTNTGLSNPPDNRVLQEIKSYQGSLGFYLRDPLGGKSVGFGNIEFNGMKPEVLHYRLAPASGSINQTTRFSLGLPFSDANRKTINIQALQLLSSPEEPSPVHLQERQPRPY